MKFPIRIGEYEIRKSPDGVIYCTCLGWKYQRLPVQFRQCKHMRAKNIQSTKRLKQHPITTIYEQKKKDKPKLLLLNRWNQKQNVDGWWYSEKLDGVRVVWDGKQFITRSGRILPFQPRTKLPKNEVLDGELWAGRGKQGQVNTLIHSSHYQKLPTKIRFIVFDLPMKHNLNYKERYALLKELSKRYHFRVIRQHRILSNKHLIEKFKQYKKQGAEGLVIRDPISDYYKEGRSKHVLKFKSWGSSS